jgi:hypothetical protein
MPQPKRRCLFNLLNEHQNIISLRYERFYLLLGFRIFIHSSPRREISWFPPAGKSGAFRLWFTPSLIPAFSPRRRRIVLRLLENSCNWIDLTVIRKIEISQQPFPLLGERIKGEGERNPQFRFSPSLRAFAPWRLGVLALNPFVPVARRFRF